MTITGGNMQKTWLGTKTKQSPLKLGLKTLLFSASMFFAVACSGVDSGDIISKNIKVSISDSSFFVTEKGVSGKIKKGETFVAELNMKPECIPVACSYNKEYRIERIDDNRYNLILEDVTRPSRVSVSCKRDVPTIDWEDKDCSIKYVMLDEDNTTFDISYHLKYHIRCNTRNGVGLERDGYILKGWNTKADYTGEHIGLGSRVSMDDGENKTLYAEWAECLSSDVFNYKVLDDNTVSLTGYIGPKITEEFVIPTSIDGKIVSTISSTFTTNIRCKNIDSTVLVLPSTIDLIEKNAFKNSNINELYFFDNVGEISLDAFKNGVKTLHVNAITTPRLQSMNYNVRFADNLDLLIENKDKKKLILFSGCSMCYGISSPLIQRNFDEYVVVDCGLNGEFNAQMQLECMLPCINEGDVLIHAPEQMNVYQYMENYMIDERIFCMCEGNYDLLADMDFSRSSLTFEAFTWYQEYREKQDESSYEEYNDSFNYYGDYLEERPYVEENEVTRDINYDNRYGFDFNILDVDKLSTMFNMYDKFLEKGCSVYFSWSPMNLQSNGSDAILEDAESYQKKLKEIFDMKNYPVISDIFDYIYEGRYFYDTDYHLNDLGIILRTSQLIADMKNAGI